MNAYDRAFDKAVVDYLASMRASMIDDMVHGMERDVYTHAVGFIAAIDQITAEIADIKKKLGAED